LRTRLILVPVATLVFCMALATAQGQESQVKWRTVKGTVVDKKGNLVASAVVYLKDLRARKRRMKPTDRDGQFSFSWVDPSVDYEIYAKRGNSVSEKLPISGSDKRREIVFKLRLDKDAE